MKRYIRANSEKPELSSVTTEWNELDTGDGITFTVYSDSGETLFEELFDYNDVDPDAIYDSAAELAILALSQKYDLSEDVIQTLQA